MSLYEQLQKEDKKELTRAATERALIFMRYVLQHRNTYQIKSRNEFAFILDMKGPFLNRIETNKGSNFTVEHLISICKIFKVSPGWLFLGNGEMLDDLDYTSEIEQIKKRLDKLEGK